MKPERLQQYRRLNPNGLTEEEFRKVEEELRHPKKGTISDECLDFKLWSEGYPSRQEAFADYVKQILPAGIKYKILEVGGGKTCRVSRLLAEQGYHMTCIDPRIESDRCRDSMDSNIQVMKEAFDYRRFSLKDYDWVIAQEPCEAAEHVIRGCLAQKVPFVMTLCACPHRFISGEMPEDVWEWYEYLLNLDRERMELKLLQLYGIAGTAVIKTNIHTDNEIIKNSE